MSIKEGKTNLKKRLNKIEKEKESYQDVIAKEAYFDLLDTFRYEDKESVCYKNNSKYRLYKAPPKKIKKNIHGNPDLADWPIPHVDKFKWKENKLPECKLKEKIV